MSTVSKLQQISFPRVSFPPFKKGNYRTWADTAKSFFIQHKLFGIVNGTVTNPAGNVLPQSYDGETRLADGAILADGDRVAPAAIWTIRKQSGNGTGNIPSSTASSKAPSSMNPRHTQKSSTALRQTKSGSPSPRNMAKAATSCSVFWNPR